MSRGGEPTPVLDRVAGARDDLPRIDAVLLIVVSCLMASVVILVGLTAKPLASVTPPAA